MHILQARGGENITYAIDAACDAVTQAIQDAGKGTWAHDQRKILDAIDVLCAELSGEAYAFQRAAAEEAEIAVQYCQSIDDIETIGLEKEIWSIRHNLGRREA